MMADLRDEIERWQTTDEGQFFERKSAFDRSGERPRYRKAADVAWDIVETLSAMSNADSGELVVGIEDDDRSVTGVPHPEDKVRLMLGAPRDRNYVDPPLNCRSQEIVTPAGKRLLHFRVDASPQVHRLSDGRYLLRRGDRNVPFAADQITLLKHAKPLSLVEQSYPPGATSSALDLELIERLRPELGFAGRPEQYLVDHYLAEERGGELAPTLAALLLFAKQPGRWHPRCGINFVRFEGTERKYGGEQNVVKRFTIEASLSVLIREAYERIRPFIRERHRLQDLFFTERLEYPTFVWQEAIVNAVAHRDYGSQGVQIEVWMFDDRMEIRSPGLPPSPVTLEALNRGDRVHFSRNPRIVSVLSALGYVQELGEGVPRMFTEMERQGFYPPAFEDVGGTFFQVTLRNQPVYDQPTLEWLQRFAHLGLTGDQKRILAHARAHGGRFTSRQYQGLVGLDIYGASNSIRELIRKGVVRSTEKGSRVYEVMEPGTGSPHTVLDELVRVLEDVSHARPIANEDVQRVLGVSRSTATRYLQGWVALGLLSPEGEKSQRRYRFTS